MQTTKYFQLASWLVINMDLTLPKVGLQVLRNWHDLRRKGSVGNGIGRRGHSPKFVERFIHCD